RSLNPFFDYWEVDPQGEHFYAYRSQQEPIALQHFQKEIRVLSRYGRHPLRSVCANWFRKAGHQVNSRCADRIIRYAASASIKEPVAIPSNSSKNIVITYANDGIPLFCLGSLFSLKGVEENCAPNYLIAVDGAFATFFKPGFSLRATKLLINTQAPTKLPKWKLVERNRYKTIYHPEKVKVSSFSHNTRYLALNEFPGHQSFLRREREKKKKFPNVYKS
ncbi:MAG: hypothetical protein ACPGC9_01825, partial [Cytophagales bacterium]